ncbi:gamma-butyrobetaine dioxygenase [Rhizoctonia solani 123E]|uniref:Gamma-butyrobetaine dioxygenase n=1 Tax=Rhizoctonia solani 123E TaxID=1423351 RepID=A0A074RZS3_9AGAM|nr:gamma-butyrobetaine dioxygenase [Rhizoctonia solani 123E]
MNIKMNTTMHRGASALLGLSRPARFISATTPRHLVARASRYRCLATTDIPQRASTDHNLSLQPQDNGVELSGSFFPRPLKLSYDWLRDSCQCAECVHPSTKQKLFRTGDFVRPVPSDASLAQGALHVQWADGHPSVFSLDFIRRYADPTGQARASSHFEDVMARRPWDLSRLPSERFVDFASIKNDPLPAYLQLLRYGILIVRGVPHESTQRGPEGPAGVSEMAGLLGLVRETFYGKLWDVISARASTNIAYTNLNLDLHMDLQYMQHPPHIQLLHCIKNRVEGGTSVFVDAIKAANDLWEQDRASFEVLAQTPIPFHYENDGHHLHHSHPTIQLVHSHLEPANPSVPPRIAHINYSPPFQAPLPPDISPLVYTALRKYADLLARPEGRFEYTLAEGDCAVFDNRRVLHARTAFWDKNAREGKAEETNRWLKGCYVEVDDLLDRTRVLLAKRGSTAGL